MIRRLSKVEYGNTLRALYGVDPAIADDLPEEVFGQGYLNSLSPLQTELLLCLPPPPTKTCPSTSPHSLE